MISHKLERPIYDILVNSSIRKKYLSNTSNLVNHVKPSSYRLEANIDRSQLRNVGIIAHINAGKTTTTERILYQAGATNTVGDVDKGNTVTDYLHQERDRGITITSAVVSFNWNKHRVNLIDTPGHVDFTIEVERSLSILDGAVTIIDASAGVEAQTITVWNQATRYKLPNIVYLNKYDKPHANYDMCIKDLNFNLNMKAFLIQLPVIGAQGFSSLVDIINRQHISWANPRADSGLKFVTQNLATSSGLSKRCIEMTEEKRESLINYLADIDDELASHVLQCDKISDVSCDIITQAARKATLNCQLCPVLIGSSFKYIGVQPLMDAILNYLPSPIERELQIKGLFEAKNEDLKDSCAFIFKILHDKRFGPLSYIKVCNGSIASQQRVQNLETQKVDQVKKIYRPFADELKEVNSPVYKDDLVVVSGLTKSRTGDTLLNINSQVQDTTRYQSESRVPFRVLNENIIVPHLTRMEPVYFCSIECRKGSEQIKLESALENLSHEDPSFSYDIDNFGIITIRGMGKLHLEIARDRIQTEYNIDSLLGPLQISYRETIEGSANEELSVNRLINSINNTLNIKLYVHSKPQAGSWSSKMLRLDTKGESSLGKLRADHRKAIENGFISALSHGPSKGFPVIDCDILLLDFTANRRCGLPVISSAASQCLMNAIRRCSPVLLEPIMLLEVVTPSSFNGVVLSDISARRGSVLSTCARDNGFIVVRSHVPLASLTDYSESLRIRTSGRASFTMELFSYSAMSEKDKNAVVRL